MPLTTLFYRIRIRNAADSADDLVVTSLPPSGTNPYLTQPPTGDGGSLDILAGAIQQGALQIRLADAITSGPAFRVLTAVLADATGKQQLLSRIAVIEESVDAVNWSPYFRGYLRRLRLITAMEWELTIGDVVRAESAYNAFAVLTPSFPKGVNIIGELITGGWGPFNPIGQTTFKVTLVTAKRVKLQYQYGPLPPDYAFRSSGNQSHYDTINKLARPFAVWSNKWYNEDANVRMYFPRLNAMLTNPTTGALIGNFTPIAVREYIEPGLTIDVVWRLADTLIETGRGEIWLDWPSGGSPAQPAVNTLYAIRVYPLDVSTLNPLHVEGHPVDIITALYTEAGIPWSAAAATALKNLLGQTLRFRGRFTGGMSLAELLAKTFFGPLGLGVRVAADGTRELFAVRDLPTAIPGLTIAVNDLRNDDGIIFDLDDESVVNRVTWTLQEFYPWSAARDGSTQPNDLIILKPITYQTINGDVGATGGKEQTYEVSGHFYDNRGATYFTAVPFFAAQASRIFDRFGRGGIRSEVQVLRGVSPKLGDFVVLNLPHLPVAVQGAVPVSQRGQALRVVQVERTRPNPEGAILTVLDAGAAAQPSISPVITVAASALDPIHFAEVTVTNVGAMTGIIELVRFQLGTGVGTPTGGIDFAARSVAELAVNNVVSIGPFKAGETAWFRAQSKDTQQFLPSPWTAWQSVVLTPVPVPSGLTVVAGANDTEKIIRWNLGSPDYGAVIRWKLTGDSDWAASVSLPAGSVEYTIRDLIPGGGGITGEVTAYAGSTPNLGESAATAFSFTPGAVSPTLPIPWSPAGWCGPQDDLSRNDNGIPDGSFGLDVTAAKWPSNIEVEVAVETAIGSGVYGSFVTQISRLVQQGYRTRNRFAFYTGNDRLRRQIRARHNQPGYTASGYTAVVTVNPWVAQQSIIPAVDLPAYAISGQVGGTYESPQAFLLVKYDFPPNPHFDYMRYRVRQSQIGTGVFADATYVVGGRDGDDLLPVQFGVTVEVRLDTVNTDGIINTSGTPVVVLSPVMPYATLQQDATSKLLTGPYLATHVGREPARLNFPFIPDQHTVLVKFYSEEHTVDPGAPRDLCDGRNPELSQPVVPAAAFYFNPSTLVGNRYCVSLPLAAAGNYRLVTIVPVNRFGQPGLKVHLKAQGDATALPNAPTAASNTSVPPAGTVLSVNPLMHNSVTPGEVTAPRVYRNGLFDGDFSGQTGTIGVPHDQIHVAYSNAEDVWEYCHVTGPVTAPRESAKFRLQTTTPLYVLQAPTGAPVPPGPLTGFQVVQIGASLIVTLGGWYPLDPPGNTVMARGGVKTQHILRRSTTAVGPWTEVANLEYLQQGFLYVPPAGTWYFSAIARCTNHTDSASSSVRGPFIF
jgi:hypothetical protein